MRSSSIELLRIVAMLSIVVGHVFYHGFHNECTDVLWLRPFTCCGVNIFVLISGYYGINFKLKSLFSLLFMVSFIPYAQALLNISVGEMFFLYRECQVSFCLLREIIIIGL